jgi:AsmA protein
MLRRVLLILATVLLLLVAAAAWLVMRFDPNQFKGLATDWVKTEYQRTLVLEGPITLSVFPKLQVRLSKVSLSEARSEQPFAALGDAQLQLQVMPLLKGQLVVDGVSASGLTARYTRDAQGHSNIDDLLRPRAPADTASAPSAPLQLDVSAVTLDDLSLTVADAMTPLSGTVALKKLHTGRIKNGVDSTLALQAALDLTQPGVKGALSGSAGFTPDLAHGSIALRDMKLAYQGDLPGAAAVDAKLQGALRWDGEHQAADAQNLSLALSANAAGLVIKDSQFTIADFRMDPARKSLSLKALKIALQATQAGAPLTLDLSWPELAVTNNAPSGSAFSGAASRGGALPLTATFKSGAPSGSFDALTLPSVELLASSQTATRQLQATLRSTLTVRPAEASAALDGLMLDAKIQDPALPALAITAKGQATASAQRATWQLAGTLQGGAFSTQGSALLSGTVPQLQVQARWDTLDLNRLLPPATAAATAPSAADTPIDLSGLRAVNGRFTLQAGQLAWQKYRIADLATEFQLDGGMLRLQQLKGRAWGGAFDASGLADARASRIALKAAANGVDVNALLKDVANQDTLSGTGRVTLDVDSAGATVNQMRSHLKGTAALALRDGSVKGYNLARALREAKAALSFKQDATQQAKKDEKTDFTEMTASFNISEGVARSSDLDMKSPFLRLGGEGSIDLGHNRLDYTARATVASTTKGQDGADLSVLKGLTIPVRLSGPFEAIQWNIRWSEVASAAVTQQLKSQLENKLKDQLGVIGSGSVKSELKNKLEDQLKGKLGLPGAAPAASGASAPAASTAPKDVLKDKLNDKLKGLFR